MGALLCFLELFIVSLVILYQTHYVLNMSISTFLLLMLSDNIIVITLAKGFTLLTGIKGKGLNNNNKKAWNKRALHFQ